LLDLPLGGVALPPKAGLLPSSSGDIWNLPEAERPISGDDMKPAAAFWSWRDWYVASSALSRRISFLSSAASPVVFSLTTALLRMCLARCAKRSVLSVSP